MTDRPKHGTTRPRLRVTFALRCEILGVSVGIAALVLLLFGGRPLGVVLALVAVVTLPALLELLAWIFREDLHRSAPRHWVVDLDQRSRDRMREFLDDTEDNPTIR